jgi:hypothetical protein
LTSQTLSWVSEQNHYPSKGVFDWDAEEVAKANGTYIAPVVNLQAPRGVSHVSGFSGRQYIVQPDWIVEVEEGDAKYLPWPRVA